MTERGRATRAKLIEATLTVVREVGYPHASTRAIAEAAGVAEGTIYRHFPDKAALFFAAALESAAPTIDWVSGLPERAGQGTVEETLIEALERLATLQDRIVPLELAILGDPELAAQRRTLVPAADALPGGPPGAIAAYLAAERRLGRVRTDVDPTEATVVILAALFGLGVTSWQRAAGMDRAVLAAAVHYFVSGIEERPRA